MFFPNLPEDREFYSEKNTFSEFEKVGHRGTKWQEAPLHHPLPLTLAEHPLPFFEGDSNIYFGVPFSLGTSELSSQKIAISPGKHGLLSLFRCVAFG